MENEGTTAVVSPKTSDGVTGWIESVIITTSQTSLGQTLFKLLDSFLWGVEKSAQWSLPSHEVAAEENGKVFGKIELVRPLPWFLFLPGLVILRIIRSGLNVGAFILGYPQIQPSGMVKFVQKTRRRLRAINTKAVKSARRKMCNSKTGTPDEKSTTESVGSPIHPIETKRKFSQVSSDEGSITDESESETLPSKIDRLAADNSTDDPDFDVAEFSRDSSTASSDNETSKDVSFNELADILAQAKDICNYDDGEKAMFISLEDLKSNSKKAEDTTDGVKRVDSSEASSTPKVSNGVVSEEKTSKTPSIPSQQASTQSQAQSSISKEK